MPKISELVPGSAFAGTELIPAVQSGATKRFTPVQLATFVGARNLGFYNVKDYGAVADGSTNDAPAIQAAINAAGAAGGGVVWLPSGTYRIQPAANTANSFAIEIASDNITLMGAGQRLTKLDFMLYNGASPATDPPPNVAGVAQRGFGIKVTKKAASGTRLNVTFQSLELNGNAPNTGSRNLTPVASPAWDVSHKGVYIDPNERFDNIIVDDCYIHAWRGEVIYYGGQNLARFVVRYSKVGDSNADAISAVGSDQLIEGNELYSCVNAGCENAYFAGRSVYRFNYVHDNTFGGLQVFPASSAELTGKVDIHDNFFVNNGFNFHQGAVNMRVFNNYFVDCVSAIWFQSPGLGGDGLQAIRMENVECFGNRMVVFSATNVTLITLLSHATLTPRRTHIHDNTVVMSPAGNTAGRTIKRVIDHNDLALHQSCRVFNNIAQNTNNPNGNSQEDMGTAETQQLLLSTTGETVVASVFDRRNWVKRVFLSWKVVTGATVLTLTVKYYDTSDVEQTITLISAVSQPVGFYSQYFELGRGGFSNVGQMQIFATAGTANRITISAAIRD